MFNERLLALIKKGTAPPLGAKHMDAERLVAAGTLCQWLTEHMNCGGADPRFFTRKRLLSADTPLRCRRKERKSARKPGGSFIFFRAAHIAQRKRRHGQIPRKAFKKEQQHLRKQWQDLQQVEKDEFATRARETFHRATLRALRDAADVPSSGSADVGVRTDTLWGLGDKASLLIMKNRLNATHENAHPSRVPRYRAQLEKKRTNR